MPRSAAQFEQIREESRERIRDAALRLFGAHGYERTSIRMIAREAGVSQGLLYNYFEGKEAVLRAIYERSMGDVAESFARAVGGATPAERLERLVRAAFAIVAERLPFWRLTYQLRMQPGVLEDLGGQLAGWTEAIVAQLEAVLREGEGASAAVEARALFAAIDGAAQHFAMDPDGYPIDEVASALVARFAPRATQANRETEPDETR